MREAPVTPLVAKLQRIALLLSLLVFFLCLTVLLGWILDSSILKSTLPGFIEMKTNAALGFVLTSSALFLQIKLPRGRPQQTIIRFLAALAVLIGLLTLLEYLFNLDLGIDQLLFHEPSGAFGGLLPNRMGVPAAISLMLLGLALVLNGTGWDYVAQAMALISGIIGLLVVTGFIYGTEFFGIATYARMSINGAVCILVLSLGILLAQPQQGFMAVITANNLGGITARKLLPAALIVPILVGWLQNVGERLGLYGGEFGETLFAIVAVCTFGVIIWRTTVLLHQTDVQRQEAETRALKLAAEQERMRALQQLISDLSHDFRTPLSIINTSAYLARKHTEPEQRQEHLDQIEQQTQRLSRLMDEMLNMSRLQTTEKDLNFQPTDINQLVRDVVFAQQPSAAAKGQQLDFCPAGILPLIAADSSELERAVKNLVMNALHFTPSKGVVVVRTALQAVQVIIEVQDTGVGIAPEDVPHIFESFYRADKARQLETGGTGLGLAIAKKIIDAHGGLIEVESAVGQGSIFRVKLPLHPLWGST